MDQALPKAIQAELELAEQIEKAMAGEAAQPQQTDTAEPPQSSSEPDQQVVDDQPPSTQQEDESWQHKYKTLSSKYNAEVPRLHQQLKESSHQIEDLRRAIEELKNKQPEPQPDPVSSLVTSKDEEAFGSDLIDLMRRASKEESVALRNEIVALKKELHKLTSVQEDVSKRQFQTEEEKFWEKLATDVPDWETINADQRWLDWLAEYDPVAGNNRQAALETAMSNIDVKRVIGLFNTWKKQTGYQAKGMTQAQKELNRQVAPSKQSTASAQPTQDKIWTLKEYENAFDTRLRHTMSEKEIDALQTEADRALAEGRVR